MLEGRLDLAPHLGLAQGFHPRRPVPLLGLVSGPQSGPAAWIAAGTAPWWPLGGQQHMDGRS